MRPSPLWGGRRDTLTRTNSQSHWLIRDSIRVPSKANCVIPSQHLSIGSSPCGCTRIEVQIWIEPSLTLISTLETLGTMPDTASLHESAQIVREIGTNPLISNKTVTFSFSTDYDFIPSLLGAVRLVQTIPLAKWCGDFTQNSQSSKWCTGKELNLEPSDP